MRSSDLFTKLDHRPAVDDTAAMLYQREYLCTVEPRKVKKVKASHTLYRALDPELMPVYRQSACR